MSTETENEDFVTIRRVLVNAAPPRAAHFVGWTQVGEQILLEIGYFDLVALSRQLGAGDSGDSVAPEQVKVDWLVTDRYILDIESGERFVRSMAQLGEHLAKSDRTPGDNANP